MAKIRLSKLQKWILNQCLKNAKEQMEKNGTDKAKAFIYREEIYYDFFKLPQHKYGTFPQSKIVTVSRSLKNLEEKGLITVPSHLRPKGCMIYLSVEYMKFLNKSAKEKSLNVNQVDKQ